MLPAMKQLLLETELRTSLILLSNRHQNEDLPAAELAAILQSGASRGVNFSGASELLVDQLCHFVQAAAFEPAVLDFALTHGFDTQKILSTQRFGSLPAAKYFLRRLCFAPHSSNWNRISRFVDHAFNVLKIADWTEEDCEDARKELWFNVEAAWLGDRCTRNLVLAQYWHSKLLARALDKPDQDIGDPSALIGETVEEMLVYAEPFEDRHKPFYASAIVLHCGNGNHITIGPGMIPVRNAPLPPAILAANRKPVSCRINLDLRAIQQSIVPFIPRNVDIDDATPCFDVNNVFMLDSDRHPMEITVKARGTGGEALYVVIAENEAD